MKISLIGALTCGVLLLCGCDKDNDEPTAPDAGPGTETPDENDGPTPYGGLYLMNEGGFGAGNSSLDYLDFSSMSLESNIGWANVAGTGSDLQYHNGHLYALVGNTLQAYDVNNRSLSGSITIESPRFMAFGNGYAYVTTWGDGQADSNGTVTVVDLSDLSIHHAATVGYQPEGIAVSRGKIYVACSGGLRGPAYEKTVWVLNMYNLNIEDKIEVEENLQYLKAASDGSIWVNSCGNYSVKPSALFRITSGPDGKYMVKGYNVRCNFFEVTDSKVYFYAHDYTTGTNSFGSIDIATGNPDMTPFVSAEGLEAINMPYGMIHNPHDGSFYICNITDLPVSGCGELISFDKTGNVRARYTAGYYPSRMAFGPMRLKPAV